MKVSPVKRYIDPKYPTSLILEEHPELLKLVPKRWQSNAVVLTALAGVCMLSSCAHKAPSNKQQPAVISRIAPVFQHGEGRGSFGCVAINPPALLSEEEAREVIQDEAKRAGINFTPYGFELRKSNSSAMKPYLPLVFDGYNVKRKISYEFVSWQDFDKWTTDGVTSTAYSRNMKNMAESLRTSLVVAKPEGYHAVFYDPCDSLEDVTKRYGYNRPAYGTKGVNWDAVNAKIDKMSKNLAKEDLRRQLKDFIEWLKAEGVI